MKISIVHGSCHGHTAKVAREVDVGGRSVAGADVALVRIDDDGTSDPDAQNAIDAVMFGSPTYNGSLGWRMRRFLENAPGPEWSNLACAGKTAAGFTEVGRVSSDKLATMALFAQHGMIGVEPDFLPSSGDGGDCDCFGNWLCAMAHPAGDDPEVMPPRGDLETAQHLGHRVADVASRLSTMEMVA